MNSPLNVSGALTGSRLPGSCFCVGMTFFSVWASSAANSSCSVGGGGGGGEGSLPFFGGFLPPPLPPPPPPPFGSSSSSLLSSSSEGLLEFRSSSSLSDSGGISKESFAFFLFFPFSVFLDRSSSDFSETATIAAFIQRMILLPWSLGSCSEMT